MPIAELHEPNVLNDDPARFPDAIWDRRNTGESNPGVATPLTASNSRSVDAATQLRLFRLLGAARDDEMGGHDGSGSPHFHRLVAYFYGRRTLDVTSTLGFLGRLPGVSAEALGEQVFGEPIAVPVDPLPAARAARAVGLLARAAVRLPSWSARRAAPARRWWSESVRRSSDAGWAEAVGLLADAQERYRDEVSLHAANLVFHTAFTDRVNTLAGEHLDEQTALALHAGVEGLTESTMLLDLWQAARSGDMESFRARHGYYAPDEGELATRPWRIDDASLRPTVAQYRDADESASPARGLARSTAARAEAIAGLRRERPAVYPVVRMAMAGARRFAVARERTKSIMLQATDVVRASASRLGQLRVENGDLDALDDAFYLTVDELSMVDVGTHDLREIVANRRELCDAYTDLAIPLSFRGDELRAAVERPVAATPASGAVGVPVARVSGLGVSHGTATGRAVVMTSPTPEHFEPGDVLVTPTTDPGWAAMLSMASALVMDMGSALSHGAIVARELGIPCVAGTDDATRLLRTGQSVRVDGNAGTVDILDETGSSTEADEGDTA